MLSVREVTKKNQNRKAITGVKWKKKPKTNANRAQHKKKERVA